MEPLDKHFDEYEIYFRQFLLYMINFACLKLLLCPNKIDNKMKGSSNGIKLFGISDGEMWLYKSLLKLPFGSDTGGHHVTSN